MKVGKPSKNEADMKIEQNTKPIPWKLKCKINL